MGGWFIYGLCGTVLVQNSHAALYHANLKGAGLGQNRIRTSKPGLVWKQWAAGLFTGCAALYSCRTVMPLCIMPISKELGWDKTESVSDIGPSWSSCLKPFLLGTSKPGLVWKQWAAGLFTGCAALYSCRTVMPLCIMPISKELGWDKTESGSVLSAFFWGYTMTQFLGGYLSDRVGGDVVLPIAACCWSLITFWTPQLAYLSEDKYLALRFIILSRVFLGIFQGFLCTEFILKKMWWYRTLLCGSVGSLLLETYGWQSVFYLLGIFGLTWMLCIRFLLINRHRRKYIPIISVHKKLVQGSDESKSTPWVSLFVKSAFWSLLVGHFCENYAFFILLSWIPTYFHENFPDAKGWVFNVVPWVVTIPSSIFGGWLADSMIGNGYSVTFVRKFMNTITMLGTASFLILISFTSSYGGALFCMASAVACCGFHNSGILVNPQDIAPKHAGSVFGIMNMAGAIPGFIGVYMAGHILEVTKSWSAVFNQTAVVAMFGWIVYTIFGTGKQVI